MMKIGGQAGAMALALVDPAGIFAPARQPALSGGFNPSTYGGAARGRAGA